MKKLLTYKAVVFRQGTITAENTIKPPLVITINYYQVITGVLEGRKGGGGGGGEREREREILTKQYIGIINTQHIILESSN